MYTIAGGTEPVFKLEIQSLSGRAFEEKPGIAQALFYLIGEGTDAKPEGQLADAIEFYGAQTFQDAGADTGSISLLCLRKHADKLLPLLAEMIHTPGFSQDELDDYKVLTLDEYKVQGSRNEFIAEQAFRKTCFGENHPYGADPTPQQVDALTMDDIRTHHKRAFQRNACQVFLSGDIDEGLVGQVNKYLGTGDFPDGSWDPEPAFDPGVDLPQELHIKGKKQQQAVLMFGKQSVSRSHPDFRTLFVLNTILGGYFGSRLMRNIREDKGMTYYIGSHLENYRYGGLFEISTEVKPRAIDRCIREIRREIDLLQTELVSEKELVMVMSFITGNLIAQCDGPFLASDYLKQFILEPGLNLSIEEDILEYRKVTAEGIRSLAREYLDFPAFNTVIVD